MLRIRIVCAGLATAIAVALAVSGARAQSATSEQVGKPLSLLAGLRPPHETKARETKAHEAKAHEAKAHEAVHVKAAHRATKKTAVKKTRTKFTRKMAAEHTRHIAVKKHEHRERSIAAATLVAVPPTQTAPSPAPANDWPVAGATPPADTASAPAPETAPAGDSSPNALVVNGQTVQVELTGPSQFARSRRAAGGTAERSRQC